MALLNDQIEALARSAGERVAYAAEALQDMIRDLVREGATSYESAEHKLARKVFSETLAAKGRTKNSGMTQYANAWDELRESEPSLGMGERARKGKGRNASVPSATTDDETLTEAVAPAEPTLTNERAIAIARPYIRAQAIMEHLAKHNLTITRLASVAADAAAIKKAAKKIKDKATRDTINDLLYVVADLGKSLQACIDESDELAIAHKLKAAPAVPADSPAAAPRDQPDMAPEGSSEALSEEASLAAS